MPFPFRKQSRAALEGATRERKGAAREHGGALREEDGSGGSKASYWGAAYRRLN